MTQAQPSRNRGGASQIWALCLFIPIYLSKCLNEKDFYLQRSLFYTASLFKRTLPVILVLTNTVSYKLPSSTVSILRMIKTLIIIP